MEFHRSIRDLHRDYEAKTVSPVEVTEAYLKKIEASDHNAYITVSREKALAQAKACEASLSGQVPAGEKPLFGVPIGVKDLFTTEGVKTTCASKILSTYIPPYTATCVKKLEDAGAIILGKLNMDEFAMGSSNENSAYGSVQHPTHPDYVPGGSSGGSATAVKADLALASLGTDTGGSIRLPASYTGLVGIKPTYGRVSRYGMVAFASSLDQAGTFGHNVEDAVRVLEVMAGHDVLDSTSIPQAVPKWTQEVEKDVDWSALKIGVPKEYFVDGLDADVEKSVRDSLAWFEKQGAQLVDVSLPNSQYAVAVYYVVAVSEASSNLSRYDGIRFGYRPPEAAQTKDLDEFYRAVRAHFGAEVKRRIILGTFALSSGYYDAYYGKACQVRRMISNDFKKAFEEVDLIASPVAPTTAFKRGEQLKDPLKMYLNDLFTIPASLSGLPAMSLPCGQGKEGLPIGLQLIGPQLGESRLFSVARGFEKGRGE